MAKVVGLGGVFIHLEGDEKELQNWYEEHLGLDMTPYGTGFIEGEQMCLISFKRGDKPAPQLNFRVDDIHELIENLRKVTEITSEVQDYDYGKFAQIKDPFGNLIELWEPVVDVYKEMVRKEIKDYNDSK